MSSQILRFPSMTKAENFDFFYIWHHLLLCSIYRAQMFCLQKMQFSNCEKMTLFSNSKKLWKQIGFLMFFVIFIFLGKLTTSILKKDLTSYYVKNWTYGRCQKHDKGRLGANKMGKGQMIFQCRCNWWFLGGV